MNIGVWVLIGVVALVVLYIIVVFNGLILLKNRAENAWSQIDVQLKRRFDLIPNLVETVKGYAKHEQGTFKMVTEARSLMNKATSLGEKAKADNMLSQAMKSLFAVAEAYPKLEANQNFMQLQEELSGTEGKIAFARQFYNDTVMSFNTKLQVFPTNTFGKLLGFQEKEFFKTEGVERKAVKVQF